MSYTVLSRKYRPKTFNEVVGQEHVVRSLRNAISSNKVAHAYLLSGTRGVGKTTLARIFAKSLRCLNRDENANPCLQCKSCLEIDSSENLNYLEIDGASNNSVDNIREVIDSIRYLPTTGDYKIYVIDEVHMLSLSAFNALLKTLEEPPSHAIFIFATTEPHKVPATVLSRVQRLDFRELSFDQIKNHLNDVIKKESIEVESEKVLDELAKAAKGSLRDSLSLLDQSIALSVDNRLTVEDLRQSLGLLSDADLKQTILSILNSDIESFKKMYSEIETKNIDLISFYDQLLDRFFEAISSIKNDLTFSRSVGMNELDGFELSELFWIYDVLTKDRQTIYNSPCVNNDVYFVLSKLILRKEILSSKKKLKISKDNAVEDRTWKGFIKYLFENSKTLAVNVERGNLLGTDANDISLAYKESEKIFYDFVTEPENKRKLEECFFKYFEKSKDINIVLLKTKEAQESNFKNIVELEEENEAKILDDRKQKLLDNIYIKEAQKIFNTQISVVKISK